MTVDVTRQNGVTILKPSGKLVTAIAVKALDNAIHRELSKSGDDPPILLFDFADVIRMTSTGLGAMMEASMTIKQQGGRVGIANLSSHIKSLIVITHLVSEFEHFDSVHEGVAALSA